MNCKPGDLAVIVSGSAFQEYIGRIVRVTTLFNEFMWRTEESLDGSEYAILLPDSCLRPIRAQGDDAIDWVSHRNPRSADLREDALTRAREQLKESERA